MNELEIERERAAFLEKISLGLLECTKAVERVAELWYASKRFELDVACSKCRKPPMRTQSDLDDAQMGETIPTC